MTREIDEIKDVAGAYRKWALEARKKYIELRLRQDPEIRGLYIRAADRVAKELRELALKTPSSYLRKRQLEELEVALRAEADRLTGGLTKAFEQYIKQAVEAGGGHSQAIALDLFKKAGMDIAGLRTMFATVNRQAVEACWARTKKGLFLSDRIWEQGENFRNAMRDIIQEAVATGQDAVKTSRMLQQYVRQGAMTLARNYPEMMKRMKGRIPGDISYEALRLARTEMTAAFGEGTIASARVCPSYIGMKWVLSHNHPVVDMCDTLAEHDEGLGRGVYSPGDEPHLPAHPNCICTLVPVHEEPEKFVERLKKWRDDPTSDQELEKWYNDIYKVGAKTGKSVAVGKTKDFTPDEIAGVKRGKPMTRDEANKGRPNPNYELNEAYKSNCQSCVVSYEARLRGYDVMARPYGADDIMDRLAKHTNLAWIDPLTGEHPEYIYDDKIDTAKKFLKFLEEKVEKGKRYTLQFSWKGKSRMGHIVSLDRDENNLLRIYDPQCGKTYSGDIVGRYLRQIKYVQTVQGVKMPTRPKIMRIDDKEFNLDVVNRVLEGAK